ncbi:hypothetical protein C9374_011500 [Naegleria lovaniensis]|uniref:Uncharacterized protein n=1 Tax=Naegleria lovaniensis TaxID=51637 RepID=A0AA88H0T1_NAELO|nr:uncharacterized protein C9374_011500 [Naegleria lovaniensis]KAG2392775.1 hypothetical protein C9374_011500 [Naegleria lovaniensis]
MGQCVQCLKIYIFPSKERLLDYSEPKNFSFEANKLSKAASNGDIETVQNLVVEVTTISINEKDEFGCTALYRAVENNHLPVAKLLLELNANPNEPTRTGKTCLHAAAENGNTEMCILLLNNGASMHATLPSSSFTPLHLAIQKNQFQVCELLLQQGALQLQSPLLSNSLSQNENTNSHSSHHHQHGFLHNLHLPRLSHARTLSNGSSASENSSTSASPMLHQNSGSLSAVSPMSPPMILASSLGLTDIVSLLLKYGANMFEKDPVTGMNCLMVAAENGHDETVFYILANTNLTPSEQERFVNEQCEASHHWSSLHFATSKGQVSVLQVLLQYGANINLKDSTGKTALHYASLRGYPECVRILIEFGADVTVKDDDDKVALDLATETLQYHHIQTQFKRSLKKRQEMLKAAAFNMHNRESSTSSFSIPIITVDANITSSPVKTASPNFKIYR